MSQKPIFVATHPRACSTAFERVFMTRRDTLQTVHEPFGDAFYYGPERLSSRFEEDRQGRLDSGFSQSTYKTVLDRIDREGAQGKRVFIKDILHYLLPPNKQSPEIAPSLREIPKRGVGTEETVATGTTTNTSSLGGETRSTSQALDSAPFPYNTSAEAGNPTVMPKEILEKFHFTFLIRHPASSIPSYYRCCVPPLVEKTGFYDFRPSEAGYDELRRFFDYVKDVGIVGPKVCGRADSPAEAGDEEESKVDICVIDADDLLDDPEGILRQYCSSVGIDFHDSMLNWSDEDMSFAREQFEKWSGFHDDAINSHDLKPRAHKRKQKSEQELYDEWTKKFGEDAAKVIQQTVRDNVEDYEYLRQFAIRP